MDVAHAAAAVKDFRPKVVYPYHYRGSDVAKFKTLVGDAADVRLLKRKRLLPGLRMAAAFRSRCAIGRAGDFVPRFRESCS
jgi:hypothetical protein